MHLNLHRICLLCATLSVAACDDGSSGDPMDPDPPPADATVDAAPDAAPDDVDAAPPFPELSTRSRDFIVTEMNLYYPEGLDDTAPQTENPCGLDVITDNTLYEPLPLDGLTIDGFDLDGVASTDDSGLCGQPDYVDADGNGGIDFAFLNVIDMIRPARPGQTIQTVLAGATAQGLLRAGLRVTDVDDLENDDHVELLVTHTLDTPLLGADGAIIGNSSVRADPDPTWHTRIPGRIVDGVLTTEPTDLALGHINLLVVQERVIEVKDAVMRATFRERADGAIVTEAVLSGWWMNANMKDAIGQAILAIGANPGELDCVLDRWSDYSSDGERCDGMSMIFKVTAVSGFLTGLEGDADEME